MAEAKFVLKEPKSKEFTLIYLMYSFNDQRLKYSTGQKIIPKYSSLPEEVRAGLGCSVVRFRIEAVLAQRSCGNDRDTVVPPSKTLSYLFKRITDFRIWNLSRA